ncbi:MAG: hypothetical protein KDE59_06685, partial [Anaerolineales bacterium]|nr:hypothetical protein [Anaerolineales bacterium]
MSEATKKRSKREPVRLQDIMPDEDTLVLGKSYDSTLMRRLLRYMLPYKQRLAYAVVLMILAAFTGVAAPWIIGKAIDEGIRGGSLSTLRMWTGAFAAVALVEWYANRGRISLMAYVGTKVVADLRQQLFRHLHSLSLNFFNNYSIGRLMSRLLSDVEVMQDFITWSIT